MEKILTTLIFKFPRSTQDNPLIKTVLRKTITSTKVPTEFQGIRAIIQIQLKTLEPNFFD